MSLVHAVQLVRTVAENQPATPELVAEVDVFELAALVLTYMSWEPAIPAPMAGSTPSTPRTTTSTTSITTMTQNTTIAGLAIPFLLAITQDDAYALTMASQVDPRELARLAISALTWPTVTDPEPFLTHYLLLDRERVLGE